MQQALVNKKSEWRAVLLAAIAAFCVYTVMYAYRKPFTAADFTGIRFWGIDYKIWLVIAQTTGYTLSKFYGIRFIAELKNQRRSVIILKFIAVAWVSLLFFAVAPPPYNIIFLIINGFPLGIIYGLVFSYLEGRRTTEFLGAVLAASFIFASGFTQSVGKYVMLEWNVSHWWMPFITGLIFFIPLVFFTWLLDKTPPPTEADKLLRTERIPMNKADRKLFIKTFLPGLVMLIIAYIMLTVIRDYRSNFASNIWNELGHGNDASIFTKSELPASIVALVLMSLLILVKRNIHALLINHLVIAAGFAIAVGITLLFINKNISSFSWMTIAGIGLYMGYIPFNCMLFDRLIATFKYPGNAGFIIYLADSFGYLGSDTVLLVKNFMNISVSWSDFFINMVLIISCTGIVLVFLSSLYFHKKYQHYFSDNSKLKYA